MDERDRAYQKALATLEKQAVAEYLTYMPYRLEMEYDEAPPAPDWTFHTGLASSGTTGIVKLANGHPDCLVLHEGLIWLYTDILGTPQFRPTPRSNAINHSRMLWHAGFKQWPASRVRAFFEGVRQMVAPDAHLFGDKATLYARELNDIQAVFPGCKLVHSTRDTWDNVTSIYNAPWWRANVVRRDGELPSEDSLALEAHDHVVGWLQQIAGHKRIMADPQKENAFLVSFEDLAEKPRETVEGLLDFLELDAAEYDWSALDTVHYAGRVGTWKDAPAIVKLKEELENGQGRDSKRVRKSQGAPVATRGRRRAARK